MKILFNESLNHEQFDSQAIFIYKDYDQSLIPDVIKSEVDACVTRETLNFDGNDCKLFYVASKPFYICTIGKEASEATFDDLRFLAHKFFAEVRGQRYGSVAITLQGNGLDSTKSYAILAEFAALSQYKFDKFKSKRKENCFETLIIADKADHQDAVDEAVKLAEAQNLARYMVDEPANIMTPAKMAETVQECAKASGFEVLVYEEDKVRELGMHAYLAVAQGSTRNPLKFIVMRYRGAAADAPVYGLVGKGLSYDSGGYSLKPTPSMLDMKMDMGGSATVIGAMKAIADAKLKINVTAVVAACQNLIGPDAYFPGDIISSMNGKTIFIGNTDAEGRLTLIDAITYIIREEKVCSVFDFATLTGAAVMAFGSGCAAGLSNNDEIYGEYETAAKEVGEKVWRLPIYPEYKELIKHKDADLTNSAGAPGTITAGMFLGEFVEDKPWVHVDIAPIAHLDKPSGYYDRGATGYGVKTCYQFMKNKQ